MPCFCAEARLLCLYFGKGKAHSWKFYWKSVSALCWKDLCWTSRCSVEYHIQRYKQIWLNQHKNKEEFVLLVWCVIWVNVECCQGLHVCPLPHSHLIQCLGGSEWAGYWLDGKTDASNHTWGRYVTDAALKEKLGAQQHGMAREGSPSSSLQPCQIKFSIKSVLWGCRSGYQSHPSSPQLPPASLDSLPLPAHPFLPTAFWIPAGVCPHPLLPIAFRIPADFVLIHFSSIT